VEVITTINSAKGEFNYIRGLIMSDNMAQQDHLSCFAEINQVIGCRTPEGNFNVFLKINDLTSIILELQLVK
jgi:hypothetical protein